MGCCASKDDHDEGNEGTPLLKPQAPPMTGYGPNEEQAFWKQVIHQTTQNLIDISSTYAEPLQDQDIETRTQKYLTLLKQLDDDHGPSITTNTTTTNNNNALDMSLSAIDAILFFAATKSSPQLEWLEQSVLDTNQALQNIRVHPIGDIVTPLTMPSFY